MTTIWILILKYMGSCKFEIQQINMLPLSGILMPHELLLQQDEKHLGAATQKLCYHHPHEHLIDVAWKQVSIGCLLEYCSSVI